MGPSEDSPPELPVIARLTLKPPKQHPTCTTNAQSREWRGGGSHRPGSSRPGALHAVAVVEAVARLVVADLALMRGRGT